MRSVSDPPASTIAGPAYSRRRQNGGQIVATRGRGLAAAAPRVPAAIIKEARRAFGQATAPARATTEGHGPLGGSRMRYIIREVLFRLGNDSEITDESGQRVYEVDGKVLSLRDVLVVRDPAGNEVARGQHKLIALRPTYEITAGGQELAEVRRRLFTPF